MYKPFHLFTTTIKSIFMKTTTYIFIFCLFCYSCSKDEETLQTNQPEPNNKVHSSQEIDEIITSYLHKDDDFRWDFVTPDVVSSALVNGDSLLAVGYKPEKAANIDKDIASININDPEWLLAKTQTLDKILEVINRNKSFTISLPDVLVMEDEVLPFFVIKSTDINVVALLRETKTVRYAEPFGYTFQKQEKTTAYRTLGKLGCGNDADNFIPSSDFYAYSPGSKVSWNYPYMKIPEAWSHSTGKNIGVAIIDTGLSPDQNKLGTFFNQGESTNRTISKHGTYKSSIWPWAKVDGPNDRCGHGTQMAGALAAPRGVDSCSVGVAYNANLVGIRGTDDVVIETSRSQNGVIDALILAANMSYVKIISMSIGTPLWSSSVADAIRYAYGRQKLLFCAAGTSTGYTNWYGVIFPARMNETVAVTGIIEGRYKECFNCHKGDKVDFTIVMQRNHAGMGTPLTLASIGDIPSRVGGSSVATATTAGIAALVWSANPSLSRDQVLERIEKSAELYPNRNGDFGWGTINALKAVVSQ